VLRTWEAATGKERRIFRFRTPLGRAEWGIYTLDDLVRALGFSPDGRLLALGLERTVYVWDALSGEEVGRFAGHEGKVAALAFSPDGRVLASAGDDTIVLLWDVSALPGRGRAAAGLAPGGPQSPWSGLGPDTAAGAIARLARAPAQAVDLLREKLRPVPEPEPALVARLVADLESDRFAAREEAARRLGEFAETIEPTLRQRLAAGGPLEVRRRVEQLLRRLE